MDSEKGIITLKNSRDWVKEKRDLSYSLQMKRQKQCLQKCLLCLQKHLPYPIKLILPDLESLIHQPMSSYNSGKARKLSHASQRCSERRSKSNIKPNDHHSSQKK